MCVCMSECMLVSAYMRVCLRMLCEFVCISACSVIAVCICHPIGKNGNK